MATTTMQPAGTVTVIGGGPYDGWCVIGTAERRICPARRYGDNNHRAYLYTALEARRDGDGEDSTVGRSQPEVSCSGSDPLPERYVPIPSPKPSRYSALTTT